MRLFLANIGRRKPLFPLATAPLGLLYIAAHLRTKFDLEIRVLNQRAEDCTYDDAVKRIVEFAPDVVGLAAITTFAYALPQVTAAIRAALPDSLILIGGPHATAAGASLLEITAADAVVSGEGELTSEQILAAHLGGGDFSKIPGLAWRDKDGQIVTNPGEPPSVDDIDTLPFPAFDLIDPKRYWTLPSMAPLPNRPYIGMFSSRGCPYQCMWCHNVFGKRYRAHSAERVVDEIAHYVKTYGVREVEFVDDTFNLLPKRVAAISELLARRNLRVKMAFPNALRADLLDEATVQALKDAGAYMSSLSLETGSPRLQEFMGKRLDIPRFLKGVELMAARRIFTFGYMMLGFPTETEAEMRETIRVARESKLHAASFFVVTPFPHTRLYDYVMKTHPEKLAGISYDDGDYCGTTINLSEVPDDIFMEIQGRAQRAFFTKPDRVYRFMRDFPRRRQLIKYLPIFLDRFTKGTFGNDLLEKITRSKRRGQGR